MEMANFILPLLCLIASCVVHESAAAQEGNDTQANLRRGKYFSIFQIVSFANDPCDAGSKNGTCYTAQECETRGGEENGSCAEGFGVCCTFEINCGETSSENSTYFESAAVTPGACVASICPSSNDICQIRLDFTSFSIEGPLTDSGSGDYFKVLGGAVVEETEANEANLMSNCLTDTFQVVGRGGVSNSDVICGVNTGEHMYVEAVPGGGCTDLIFQIGNVAATTRQWSIKATQYSCSYPNLAPAGCTQYFFGADTNTVQTFNFGGYHLAHQDQTICVRREKNNCRICWFAAATDFAVSGEAGAGLNSGSKCCGYGEDGDKTGGYDCVNIPGAEQKEGSRPMTGSNVCGRDQGLVTAAAPNAWICSQRTPFYLRFRSDGFEFETKESMAPNIGARLVFQMDCPT